MALHRSTASRNGMLYYSLGQGRPCQCAHSNSRQPRCVASSQARHVKAAAAGSMRRCRWQGRKRIDQCTKSQQCSATAADDELCHPPHHSVAAAGAAAAAARSTAHSSMPNADGRCNSSTSATIPAAATAAQWPWQAAAARLPALNKAVIGALEDAIYYSHDYNMELTTATERYSTLCMLLPDLHARVVDWTTPDVTKQRRLCMDEQWRRRQQEHAQRATRRKLGVLLTVDAGHAADLLLQLRIALAPHGMDVFQLVWSAPEVLLEQPKQAPKQAATASSSGSNDSDWQQQLANAWRRRQPSAGTAKQGREDEQWETLMIKRVEAICDAVRSQLFDETKFIDLLEEFPLLLTHSAASLRTMDISLTDCPLDGRVFFVTVDHLRFDSYGAHGVL